jgi:hypothetical protein
MLSIQSTNQEERGRFIAELGAESFIFVLLLQVVAGRRELVVCELYEF